MKRFNHLAAIFTASILAVMSICSSSAVDSDALTSDCRAVWIDHDKKIVYYESAADIDRTLLEQGYAAYVPNSSASAVSEISDSEIVPYGNSKPSLTWDIAAKGECPIEGKKSNTGPLYSKYLYTGCSAYDVKIVNNSQSNELNIYAKSSVLGTIYNKQWIPKNFTVYYQIKDRKTSDKFYLEFFPGNGEAGVDVEGYIREW